MFIKIVLASLLGSTIAFAGTINIAVAANVSYAIDDLKKEFHKKNPDTKVNVTLGSSGKLTAQITHGAPYDIFISANMSYPNKLYDEKIAITKPIVYAQGALSLLSNTQRSFRHGIYLLENMLVKRIAIANPKTAPYGKAAFEVLENAKILESVKNKIIYAESISQTVTYTLMAADVGIVAKSSLYSKKMKKYKKNIHWVDIDTKLYTPIKQGMSILKHAQQNKEAKAFYEFIQTKEAKMILQSYGYIIS